MTAKDSKSTPKKAEDATRHPLALLADWIEAGRAYQRLSATQSTEEERSEAALVVCRTHDALQTLSPIALRAQAEAEAGLREEITRLRIGMFHALAHLPASPGRAADELNATLAFDAALAQAGGGG